MNLICSESAQWLLSSGVCKISRAFITPMGMPMRPRWANDYSVAYLQAKAVPMNFIWSESTNWLLSNGVSKVPRALIMLVSMAMWPWWTNDHEVAHLQAKMISMNLIWSESVKWLLSYSICKVLRALIVRRAGLLWSQQDFEWRWSVPLFKCLTVLEFSFILFDLCLLITFFNFIMNYVPIVTFWIFTYHKIWILSIMFCFIWSYWIIYFLACLEVSWRVVS